MQLTMRPYQGEDDFWRIRAFLREMLVLNQFREKCWHVVRFDYWRCGMGTKISSISGWKR